MSIRKRKIFVIGHRNPDTDSICSAIVYAALKNRMKERDEGIQHSDAYMPVRCGHVNEETKYVLDHFKVPAPKYMTDVSPQVADIEIRRIPGISEDISLNTAYRFMKEQECVTLPVIDEDNHLRGVITINDIAESDMDMFDNHIIGKAETPIKNILTTLDGKLLCGDPGACITKGKTTIAASSTDIMEDFIQKYDLVITANRAKAHNIAINKGACCLVICGPHRVSRETIDNAERHHVTVIETAHDTYTTARLINHSMPVKSFMASQNLLTFRLSDSVEYAREVMTKHRVRDYPILDSEGHYVGMISRRNLLGLKKKQIILVDHNELSQAVDGADDADILEIIDHHRLGTIETLQPVFFRCQPLGCTATIIYRMCQEEQLELSPVEAGLLCSAIISDTLMFRSPTCTELDQEAAKRLAEISGIADISAYAKAMFKAGSDLTNKSAEDIFFQDFKKFNVGEVSFGAGQINSMSEEDFPEIIEKLRPYMERTLKDLNVDSLYFLLTGILSCSSQLICVGKDAVKNAEEAFGRKADGDVISLPGVMSRKKQFIPPMAMLLQQK